MSDEQERAWLPTHLQQAEKVLDNRSPDVIPKKASQPKRTFRRRKAKGPSPIHTSFERATVEQFKVGEKYDFDVHNSLTNTVKRVSNMTFVRVDESGILWFRDPGTRKMGKRQEQMRYFRPGAIFKVKGRG